MATDTHYLIVDAGNHIGHGSGGHAHNDTLSIELCAYGQTLIVDPGMYVYTSNWKWRNWFRSTRHHNTVIVDDEEINRFDTRTLFSLGCDAVPTVCKWECTPEFDFFEGEHDGYARLRSPVIHRRQIYFDKVCKIWLIRDLVTGSGVHGLSLYFHFVPSTVYLDQEAPLVCRLEHAGGTHLIILPLETRDLQVFLIEEHISPSYGVMKKAPVLRYQKRVLVPTEFVTLLWAWPGNQSPPGITKLQQTGSSAVNRIHKLEAPDES